MFFLFFFKKRGEQGAAMIDIRGCRAVLYGYFRGCVRCCSRDLDVG